MVLGIKLHQLPTCPWCCQLSVSVHLSRLTHSEDLENDHLKKVWDDTTIGDKHFSFMPGIGTTNAIFEVQICGYSARYFPRRSHGGGLAVIFRGTLATNLTFKTKFDFDHTSFELIQVSVTLQTSALHFMCMYRPPPSRKNKLTDSLFSEQFPDIIDMCNSLRGQICILGDMSIHYDCPDHPLTAKTLNNIWPEWQFLTWLATSL